MDGPFLRIEPMADPPGLRLFGEIDASNAHQLALALDEVASADGDLHMDLAGVVFMDSTAISVLLRTARELDGRGELVLMNAGSLVANVLRLIRADQIPGLRVFEQPE